MSKHKKRIKRQQRDVVKVSDYISQLPDNVMEVVGWVRESSKTQKLKKRIREFRTECRKRGVRIVKLFCCVHTGKITDYAELREATRYAVKHGLPLTAMTSDRFVRHRNYMKTNPVLLPGRLELEDLVSNAAGATLYTLMHPDTDPLEVRGQVSKDGAEHRPGPKPKIDMDRPYAKTRIRNRFRPVAIRLRKEGYSIRKIARKLDKPKTTVQGWVEGV